MYERYWKLERPAFQGDHAPGSYFESRTHQAAILKLRYLIDRRLGAGLLIGAHGLGKTFLMHVLESQVDGPVARLVFPQMSPNELLAYLASKLGAELPNPGDALRTDLVLQVLERRLSQLASQGRHPILIVDEAQVLTPEHFQILHLLLNLPAEANSHFSLILVGEPDLLPKVQRIGGLDDRIAVRTTLRSLTEEETGGYVRHRLSTAGSAAEVFTEEALHTLWQVSQGIPRRINQLCDLSLLVGYADCLTSVSPIEVEAAADELVSVVVE
jgi:MSHA biogenesis protein MshM